MNRSLAPALETLSVAAGSPSIYRNGDAVLLKRLSHHAARFVRGTCSLIRARMYLRKANQRGRLVGVRGRPYVVNDGLLEIGDRVRLYSYLVRTELNVGPSARLTIGDDTFINNGVVLSCRGSIQIGARCQIAPQVVIMDNDYHGVDDRSEVPPSSPVIIEDDVWLATRSTILRGVRVGRGAVVAAGAVVTRDVPPFTLVAGVPARIVRQISPSCESA
jgi:acetyltransferase-like isoleucine patch superfamily enzyme